MIGKFQDSRSLKKPLENSSFDMEMQNQIDDQEPVYSSKLAQQDKNIKLLITIAVLMIVILSFVAMFVVFFKKSKSITPSGQLNQAKSQRTINSLP